MPILAESSDTPTPRSAVDDLLNRALEVRRATSSPDGMGGKTTAMAAVGTIMAKVDQPSATEQLVAAQSGSNHSHNVYTAPASDVRRGDELHGDGQIFKVEAVLTPSEPVYLKCLCELIQSEGE